MTSEQHFNRMIYNGPGAGHQMFNFAHPQRMGQPGHPGRPPTFSQNATSAFRPAVAPQVPSDQSLFQTELVHSREALYHQQQQMVPCRNINRHTTHPHQILQQQQHISPNGSVARPAKRFKDHDSPLEMPKRYFASGNVQSVAPFQYRPGLPKYDMTQTGTDPESLHQELRMLHALHYQEKTRKEELLTAHLQQTMDMSRKLETQNSASQLIYKTQGREQMLCQPNNTYKKPVAQTRNMYPNQIFFRQQEEFYQQKNRYCSQPIHPDHAETLSYSPSQAEIILRQNSSAQKVPRVPQVGYTSMQQVPKTGEYHKNELHKPQRYCPPQQFCKDVSQYPKSSYHHTQSDVDQNSLTASQRRNYPAQSAISDKSHKMVKPQSQKPHDPSSSCDADIQVVQNVHEDLHFRSQSVGSRNPIAVDKHDMAGHLHHHPSQHAVSIRQEQLHLKEALEKSLQKASVETLKKEETKSSPRNAFCSATDGTESLPRIVEVRSLANPDSSSPLPNTQTTPKRILQSNMSEQVDVVGDNVKPVKAKPQMMRSIQEIQETPVNVHRVPSRGSIDSENGRKDSWDSGIESPPWQEVNKEAAAMKRAMSLSSEESVGNLSTQDLKTKQGESRQVLKSSPCVGLDLSMSKFANVPNLRRAHSLTEEYPSGYRLKASGQESAVPAENLPGKKLDRDTSSADCVDSVPQKRNCPPESSVPLKVQCEDPEVIDCSTPREKGSCDEFLGKENKNIQQEAVQEKNFKVECEHPLDLSVKKEKAEHDRVKDGLNDNTKEGDLSTPDNQILLTTENQIQEYFGNIMMRALKRLWSDTKCKLERDEADSQKPECAESSDEDSGKYFKPSSETTLKNIPGVDERDEQQTDFGQKIKNPPTSTSSESLETALCELMQQSPDVFKHGVDIFQHFDKMIKQELMAEIERQPIKHHEASTSSETKILEDTSQCKVMDEKTGTSEEQTSEAVALCKTRPVTPPQDYEEMDDSQNLVIVESSISPKLSPDSQETENKIDNEVVSLEKVPEQEKQDSVNEVDSSVGEHFTSMVEMYENAARNAAEKAARLAAEKAAKMAAEKTAAKIAAQDRTAAQEVKVPSVSNGETRSDCCTVKEMCTGTEGLSPLLPPASLNKNDITAESVKTTQAVKFHPTHDIKSPVYVKQPHMCVYMTQCQDLPNSNKAFKEADTRTTQGQLCRKRRYSEPASAVSYSSSQMANQLKRKHSEEASCTVTSRNAQIPSTSVEAPDVGKLHNRISGTTWQAQGMDINKVKLMRVPSSQADQNHKPTSAPNIKNIQEVPKHFQKSPIVLLPKMTCIPGQPFSQPTMSVVQGGPPQKIIVIQQGNQQTGQNVAKIPNAMPVQIAMKNFAPDNSSSSPQREIAPSTEERAETVTGPFHMIRKEPTEQPTAKKPCVSSYIITYKNVTLPGVVRSGVPFVPPRMLQEGMFPQNNFDDFCHTLQECNIMQRYMTVLERAALLTDLRHNKISSCKLVSLEEFHQKYDDIRVILQAKVTDQVK